MAEALSPAREIGATSAPGGVLLRGESAFYTGAVVSAAARRAGVRFSIMVSMNSAVRDRAHRRGRQDPDPLPERGLERRRGRVDLRGRGRRNRVVHRLRRNQARDHPPAGDTPGAPAAPRGQDELLPAYRYHTFFTDTALSIVDAGLTHAPMPP